MTELKEVYPIYSQIFIGISMLIGLASLTAISVIKTSSMVKHRTALDLETSKYLSPNKSFLTFIGLFIFVVITDYFLGYNEYFNTLNIFTKNLVYILGIYLGVGSIIQSVKRIRQLKKANYLGSEEKISVLESDRNKKIIALAAFILSYFIFYLF